MEGVCASRPPARLANCPVTACPPASRSTHIRPPIYMLAVLPQPSQQFVLRPACELPPDTLAQLDALALELKITLGGVDSIAAGCLDLANPDVSRATKKSGGATEDDRQVFWQLVRRAAPGDEFAVDVKAAVSICWPPAELSAGALCTLLH